jgi:chemotaxis protein methyltransferase CheR
MNLNPFKELIKERSGIIFDDARIATLENGVAMRMSEKNIKSDYGYLNCILHDKDEFNHLLDLLTINETYFFREQHHLNLLADRLIPEMLAENPPSPPFAKGGWGGFPERRIKILSAGCSTGEEPYSILMSLMEKYGSGIENSVSIVGFDIDGNAIRKAQEGIFTSYSFRDMPRQLIEKYFEPLNNNLFKIEDIIRRSVKFMRFNLLNDDIPDELKGVDVIFYRNVSIYFDPAAQRKIFKKLSDLLNENGYLFVGSTETISHNIGVLSLIEMDGIFLFRKMRDTKQDTRYMIHDKGKIQDTRCRIKTTPPPQSPLANGESKGGIMNRASCIVHHSPTEQSLFKKALSLAKDKKYEDAIKSIDAIIENDPGFIKAYMLKSGIFINLNLLEDAKKICLMGIEKDRWCLEGHLLLGLIAKMQRDDDNAIKSFKEALYIQSSCWPAHFYLAEIYRFRAENGAAIREYEIVSKLLKRQNVPDHGFTLFTLSFPVEQILHLCNYHLAELRKQSA